MGFLSSIGKILDVFIFPLLINKHVLQNSRLKVVSATFLLVCFSSLEESTYEIWKNVFYFTSNVNILDIQISRRHQMPKHKTRNTFY